MMKSDGLQVTLQNIYDAAVKAMSELIDTNNMYTALHDEDTGDIEFPLAYEKGQRVSDEEKVEGKPYGPRPFGERKGLTEWVIRHKKPLLIERDFDAWIEAQEDVEAFPMDTQCWLGAPMLLRDKVIGVIGLQNFEREGVFDRGHQDLLMTIASQAATAIENARLFESTRRIADERQQRLELLQQISERMVAAGLEPDEVLALVARTANDISGSDLTSIYRYDQESSTFTSGVWVDQGSSIKQVEPSDLPDPEGLATHIAETHKPVFVNDVTKHPETTDFAKRHQLQAFAGLPLTIGGRQGMFTTTGVLFVNFKQPHSFSDDEQEILRHLANQAAVAIAYAGAQASAQAKEQLATLGTAAATLQHRLGNTINVILPAVMRLRYRVGDEATNNNILDTIERNAQFATEVIRRMQTPLQQEPFVHTEINSLLHDAIRKCVQDSDRFPNAKLATNLSDLSGEDDASTSTALPQITITATLDEEMPYTYASVGQLTEVFRVLVENAIKAIYPQTGVVKITSKLEKDRSRPCVDITVSDTGKGIDEKTKSRLFKQPVPRKEFGQGAGLGLWLSHIIVRSHQGAIELLSAELDKGSTFLVQLPILDQPPLSHISQPRETL